MPACVANAFYAFGLDADTQTHAHIYQSTVLWQFTVVNRSTAAEVPLKSSLPPDDSSIKSIFVNIIFGFLYIRWESWQAFQRAT